MSFGVFAHVIGGDGMSQGPFDSLCEENQKSKIQNLKNHILPLVSIIFERWMLVNPIGFRPSMICADQVFGLRHVFEHMRTFRGPTVPIFVVLKSRST